VRDARDSLALSSIADGLDDYKRLQNVLGAAKNAVSPIQADVSKLKGQIAVLEREIREQQRPADELNADLKRYLGHGELQLVVRGTGYEITRGSEPAKALSEGEATAIALLYFLKSLEDRGFDKKNGVVVIDDHVSSLDANALYLAFGFIRQRTDAVGQLFILTHNFEFFRQVKNWFHHLRGQSKRDASLRPARFYMLGRSPGASRSSTLMPLDPLLEQYESEYHYLFACVLRAVQAGPGADLEGSYHLPNVARRLLETFLAFRRPQSSGELWKKLKDVPFDEARKARVIRFVHTHSHSDAVGAPQHDLSLLSEACPVLADLLDLIRAEDSQHYEAMVRLICGGDADGNLA
jgi:wobble nucleotide-excising tRNase